VLWLAVLHPVPQAVQAHDGHQGGGGERRRGAGRAPRPRQVRRQVPGGQGGQGGRVGRGHDQPHRALRSVAGEAGLGRPPHLPVAVAVAAHDAGPVAGALPRGGRSVPLLAAGRLLRRGGRVLADPRPLRRLEAEHVGHPRLVQGRLELDVVAVEAVGHRRPEGHPGRPRGGDQLQGDGGLGPEGGIAAPPGEAGRGGVGLDVHRPVDPLVGPQAGHGHDAVVHLADDPEVLPGDVRGLGPVLAVAGVVQDQHPVGVGPGGGVRQQPRQAPRVDRRPVPGGLREEVLQLLGGRVLRPDHRLRPGQRRQGLVPVAGQQEALQVGPEGAALGQRPEAGVEAAGVGLQRPGGLRARLADRHGALLTRPLLPQASRP
jgi:hypothetical protein